MSPFRKVARAGAVALALAPVAAVAHMITDPAEGPAGDYLKVAFRVTHGCQGTPTISVTVRIPDGVIGVKPQPKPGWTIDIKTRPVTPPVEIAHEFTIRETASEITWRGGSLANAHFDDFVLTMRTPDKPGTTLYFPATQTCERGSYEWIEVPAADAKPSEHMHAPAPAVKLRAR